MISLLKALDYIPPLLQIGKFGNVEVKKDSSGFFYLYINGESWMVYNSNTHAEAYELYSHYILAKGHVIVTGMGFGIRENWILTKPDVTKLTIIERNRDLIEMHKKNSSLFLNDPRVSIINCDASNYKGSCDVLLLDHYESETYDVILKNVKLIHDNINCKTMWVWPLERIIMYARKLHTFNNTPHNLITKYQAFQHIKENWMLPKLHNFSEQEINLICMMFNSKIFSHSEFMLNTFYKDKEKNNIIYGYI